MMCFYYFVPPPFKLIEVWPNNRNPFWFFNGGRIDLIWARCFKWLPRTRVLVTQHFLFCSFYSCIFAARTARWQAPGCPPINRGVFHSLVPPTHPLPFFKEKKPKSFGFNIWAEVNRCFKSLSACFTVCVCVCVCVCVKLLMIRHNEICRWDRVTATHKCCSEGQARTEWLDLLGMFPLAGTTLPLEMKRCQLDRLKSSSYTLYPFSLGLMYKLELRHYVYR